MGFLIHVHGSNINLKSYVDAAKGIKNALSCSSFKFLAIIKWNLMCRG